MDCYNGDYELDETRLHIFIHGMKMEKEVDLIKALSSWTHFN